MSTSDRCQNTIYLNSLAQGGMNKPPTDIRAMDHLFASTLQELRQLARSLLSNEQSGHILQPTALVNEAYLRLFDLEAETVQGRIHFMNLAARAMRRVLVDQARLRETQKRGGGWQPVTLTGVAIQEVDDQLDLLALDRVLEDLANLDPRAAEVVELRFFGGMTMEEIADQMGVSRRTIQKDWRFATIWLRRELGRSPGS